MPVQMSNSDEWRKCCAVEFGALRIFEMLLELFVAHFCINRVLVMIPALAEIISKREAMDGWEYYVHFIDCK